MGKVKGGGGSKGGASSGRKKSPTAKVAHTVTTTMSKRSMKKNERRKVAQQDRNLNLVMRLQDQKAADEAASAKPNHFVASGLMGALDEIAAASPAKDTAAAAKNATNGRTNKGKRLLVAQESSQLSAVLNHPAFAANPIGSIFDHLNATLPPGPATADAAGAKKKKKRKGRQ